MVNLLLHVLWVFLMHLLYFQANNKLALAWECELRLIVFATEHIGKMIGRKTEEKCPVATQGRLCY